jgi:hypothetical protein
VIVPFKLISERIITEESKKFAEIYMDKKKQSSETKLSKRMAHFKKNEEASGWLFILQLFMSKNYIKSILWNFIDHKYL